MRSTASVVTAFAFVALLSGAAVAQSPSASTPAPKPVAVAQAAPQSTLAALQAERRKLLDQMYQLLQERYKTGTMTREELNAARLTLIETDLEMTTDHAKRVALREDVVRIRRENEEAVRSSRQSGVGSAEDEIHARLLRLDAEIALEKEKAAGQRSVKSASTKR